MLDAAQDIHNSVDNFAEVIHIRCLDPFDIPLQAADNPQGCHLIAGRAVDTCILVMTDTARAGVISLVQESAGGSLVPLEINIYKPNNSSTVRDVCPPPIGLDAG